MKKKDIKTIVKQDSFITGIDINEDEYNSKVADSRNQHDDSKLVLDILSEEAKSKGFTIKDLWFNRTKSANESFKVDNNFKSKITVK